MKLKQLCFLLFVYFVQIVCIKDRNGECFTAAVYEHQRYGDDIPFQRRFPEKIIDSNLKIFEQVSEFAAKFGTDIIVFPEDGVYQPPESKSKIRPYLEDIPDEMNVWNPCEDESFANRTILRRLSCVSKKNRLYVVANFGDLKHCNEKTDPNCSSGFYAYNTAVVFNNKGVLVAKYHKYHLFAEGAFNVPKEQQFITFKTPFGTFGTYICFDMIFKEPGIDLVEKYKVNTIVFPTWWFDELPFLSAHQYQESWAIKNNVNLLAANINKINLGSTGSGIYSGHRGAIAYQHETMGAVSTLIISHLHIDPKNSNSSCSRKSQKISMKTNKSNDEYHFKTLDISSFNNSKLTSVHSNLTLCQQGFCCSLSYERVNGTQDYYFIVGNRIRKLPYLDYEWCEQMCALVAYNTTGKQYSLNSDSWFSYINLRAKFTTKYVYPSILTNQLQLVPTSSWEYINNQYSSSLEAKHLKFSPVISSLYGRCYDKDPPYRYNTNPIDFHPMYASL